MKHSDFEKRIAEQANAEQMIGPDDVTRQLGLLLGARIRAETARAEGFSAAREKAADECETPTYDKDTAPAVRTALQGAARVIRSMRDEGGES